MSVRDKDGVGRDFFEQSFSVLPEVAEETEPARLEHERGVALVGRGLLFDVTFRPVEIEQHFVSRSG
jgi:hypothetical protein